MEQKFFNEITGHFNLREPKSNRPSSIFFVVSLGKKQIQEDIHLFACYFFVGGLIFK